MDDAVLKNTRSVRAPRGPERTCRTWGAEAALRMLMNNLDPEVAERPEELVVYGGIGRAARNWDAFDRIVDALRALEADETLLVQSGKPVGVFRTHADAPRVLIANSNLVPKWADWAHFNELDRKGLMMYGQMTAGSWIYNGTQGIVQRSACSSPAMARPYTFRVLARQARCWTTTPVHGLTIRLSILDTKSILMWLQTNRRNLLSKRVTHLNHCLAGGQNDSQKVVHVVDIDGGHAFGFMWSCADQFDVDNDTVARA